MPDVDDNPVLAVAIEGFLERHRRGESVSVEAWAKAYPDVADELRELLPPLIEMDLTISATEDIPRQAPLPPRIGDCRITRELGRGGMGVVYEGIQEGLDRKVAVKVLLGAGYDGSRQARFLREAKLVASLDHPNIIPIYAVGTDQGAPFIVMRLVRGHSLAHLDEVADGQARQRRAVALIAPVAKALAFAHNRGITHRDIKPANILEEDGGGAVYLCDFGLAKGEDSPDLTSVGMVTGTLMYLAPERLSGVCDGRSDIYALGLSLLEVASGRTAFTGMDQSELVRRIVMEGAPAPLRHDPTLDRGLARIIAKATAHDPKNRHQRAEELVEELAALVIGRNPGTGSAHKPKVPGGTPQGGQPPVGQLSVGQAAGQQSAGRPAGGRMTGGVAGSLDAISLDGQTLSPKSMPPVPQQALQSAPAQRRAGGPTPQRGGAPTRAPQPARTAATVPERPRQEPPSAWRTLFPLYGGVVAGLGLLIWASSSGTTPKPAQPAVVEQPATVAPVAEQPVVQQAVHPPTPAPQPYTPVVQSGSLTAVRTTVPTPAPATMLVPEPPRVQPEPEPQPPEQPVAVVQPQPQPRPAPDAPTVVVPQPPQQPPPGPNGEVWTAAPGQPGGPPLPPDGVAWTAPPGQPGGPPMPPPPPPGGWTAPPGQPGGPPLPPEGGPPGWGGGQGGGPGGGGPGGGQGGERPRGPQGGPGGGGGGGPQGGPGGGGQRPRR